MTTIFGGYPRGDHVTKQDIQNMIWELSYSTAPLGTYDQQYIAHVLEMLANKKPKICPDCGIPVDSDT